MVEEIKFIIAIQFILRKTCAERDSFASFLM